MAIWVEKMTGAQIWEDGVRPFPQYVTLEPTLTLLVAFLFHESSRLSPDQNLSELSNHILAITADEMR